MVEPTAQDEPMLGEWIAELGLRDATDEFQRHLISETLTQADFNWAEAARRLQTDRANLTRLAKRLGITVSRSHSIERSR